MVYRIKLLKVCDVRSNELKFAMNTMVTVNCNVLFLMRVGFIGLLQMYKKEFLYVTTYEFNLLKLC